MNSRKAIQLALGFALFLVAVTFVFDTNLRLIFYKAEKEITYKFDKGGFCDKEKISCMFFAELHLANTGRALQTDAQVNIFEMPKHARTRVNIFDLSAADPRESEPVYSISRENNSHRISIQEIAPGTLMIVRFSSLSAPEKMSDLRVDLQHDGFTFEADPRGTTIARVLTRIFTLFLW